MTTPVTTNTQGAGPTDIDPSQTSGGPPAPKDEGVHKPKGGDDEEHGTPKQKSPAELKAEADKAAADKAAADEPAKSKDGELTEYVDLGHEAGNAAIELLKEKGVSAVEANGIFAAAVKSGNLNDVQWDVLESRVGKASAALIKRGVADYYDGVVKKEAELATTVHAEVGGKDNWTKLVDWAHKAEAADTNIKAQVDDIRAGLAAGGKWAKAAAKDLAELYNKAPGNVGLGANKVTTGDTTAPVTGTGITRAEYLAELHKFGDYGPPAQVAALRARRLLGRQQGI